VSSCRTDGPTSTTLRMRPDCPRWGAPAPWELSFVSHDVPSVAERQ